MPVKWDGLAEFKADLHALPADCVEEANGIVLTHAESAKQQIVAAYPFGPTGNLKRGVTMRRDFSQQIASATVKSGARHAHIFERGSRQRRTRQGWNRGRMPEAPFTQRMIPIVIRVRRQMVNALIAMLERKGLIVKKEAA